MLHERRQGLSKRKGKTRRWSISNSAIETFATIPVISWIVTITHLSLTESVLNSGNVNGCARVMMPGRGPAAMGRARAGRKALGGNSVPKSLWWGLSLLILVLHSLCAARAARLVGSRACLCASCSPTMWVRRAVPRWQLNCRL